MGSLGIADNALNDEDLATLLTFPRLSYLYLYGPGFSTPAVASFKKEARRVKFQLNGM